MKSASNESERESERVDLAEPPTNQGIAVENSARGTADSKRVAAVLWVSLAAIIVFWICKYSIHLSAVRIYRADECRNVCATWFLATGQGTASGTPVSLFYLPLMWLSRGATHSVELYVSARFFSTILLWLNVLLLTVAAGQKIFSRRSVVILAVAATLVPLWDFGFEIRPDNLVLTGLLLMWCVLRVRPEGLQSYFIGGVLAIALQFVDIRSVAYSLPLSLAACAFPPAGQKMPRWKPAVGWLIGAVVAVLFVRVGYGASGLWDAYVRNWHNSLSAADEKAAGHWAFMVHLVFQTPLLLAVAAAAVVALAMELRSHGRAALSRDGLLPEGLLCVLAFAVFAINPTPSPYQLVYLAAFAFPLAARFVSKLWSSITAEDVAMPLICGIILFGHVVPFVVAIQKMSLTSQRQEGLMALAEEMTAPGKDFVYDETGLVPTRRSVQYEMTRWNENNPGADQNAPLRSIFAAQPPSVIIVGNSFDELSKDDYDFIRGHYVPIADDVWELGEILPAGGGTFEVIHAGRYQITSAEASNIRGTYRSQDTPASEPKFPPLKGTLDGKVFDGTPVELRTGTHQLLCGQGTNAAVAWLGPSVDGIHRMLPGDHRHLFVKWH